MKLMDKLHMLMLKREISANDLAIATNIERSTLTRILNGSTARPHFETIYTLAKYFDVNAKELVNEIDSEFRINDYKNTSNNLSDILSNLMLKTGILSTSLLNKYTGVPFSVLSDILNYKTEKPSMKTLQSLASFFNITVAQIMGAEQIPDYKIAEINPARKMLPVLKISKFNNWLKDNTKNIESYTSSTRQIIGINSFAIIIDSNNFGNDFSMNHLLIVDNEEKPNNNDFIVANFNNKISIFEFKEIKKFIYLREAGKYDFVKINIHDKFELFGVVIQEIINRKQ